MSGWWRCLFYFVGAFLCYAVKNMPDEALLIKDLLKDYVPSSRPVLNYSDPVYVNMAMSLESIDEMDLKHEFIALRGVLSTFWYDPFLSWNKKEYGGVTETRLRESDIWIPDIFLENQLHDHALSLPKFNVRVWSDGRVEYDQPFYYRTDCNMDIMFYPFDKQKCQLIFASWDYTAEQLNLSFVEGEGLSLFNFQSSSQFDLILEESSAYVILDNTLENPQVNYITLSLRRKTLYYTYTILVPSVVISFVSLLVFRLSPGSGEKVSLGITVMLVYQMLVWSVGEELPENGDEMPILAAYLTAIFIMTAISVGMSVLVLNTYEKNAKVPKCVHFLFVDFLAKVLCLKVKADNRARHDEYRLEQLQLMIDEILIDNIPCLESEENSERMVRRKSNGDIQQEILRVLQMMMLMMKEMVGECDYKRNEWKTVAEVIDRLFFWFFLAIVVLLSLGILVVAPQIS